MLSARAPAIPQVRTISFDVDWVDSWEALRLEFQSSGQTFETSVRFSDELLEEISTAIETHSASERVPYIDSKVAINNVGESYRQDEIKQFCQGESGENMPWLSGFLMPEMANLHDKTAVAICVIKRNKIQSDGSDELSETEAFSVLHAGYMERESAMKVHKKILNLMGKNLYVPLLIRITGGDIEKQNYGVFAYAMTDKIKF